MRIGIRVSTSRWLVGLLLAAAPEARAHPSASLASAFAAPMRTDLRPVGPDDPEHVTVVARRPAFRTAPSADHDGDRAPWELGTAIRDTMTGADTAAFGDAYNLGSPMGSDERGNETGGPFVAPRHE